MAELTERLSPALGTQLWRTPEEGAVGRVGSLFMVVTLYRTDVNISSAMSGWMLVEQF